MQGNAIDFAGAGKLVTLRQGPPDHHFTTAAPPDISESDAEIEKLFAALLLVPDLDQNRRTHERDIAAFEDALETALDAGYRAASGPDTPLEAAQARLFLHRVLYRINRLKFFWYDELSNYVNERSNYVRAVRDRIEDEWQRWETQQINSASLQEETSVEEALQARSAADLDPAPSLDGLYFRDRVGEIGYRRLLEIASLDGLVEASQLSRTLGGVGNEIHAMMTRLLVEEYGGGRLPRKHSSFFTAMLEELGMNTEPEAYFDVVPWEVLANINHSFLLSERKRFYLRYVGGLLYTEISVPAGFRHYRAAAERLGFSERAMGYWDLHIREDERHGQWMLHRVSFPLAARYPRDAWELIFGYDQQRFMSDRAGAAVARAAREAEGVAENQAARRRPAPANAFGMAAR